MKKYKFLSKIIFLFVLCMVSPVVVSAKDRVCLKSIYKMGTVKGAQDGAIYKGTLFKFTSNGKGFVYNNINNLSSYKEFILDKSDILKPHSNLVCFSSKNPFSGNKFPYLYCNIYNNYSKSKDKKLGTCCVYKLYTKNEEYKSKLSQVIKVGFIDEEGHWSADGDVSPFGNFIVDTDKNTLYVYVMNGDLNVLRFYRFRLPKIKDGVYNKTLGCNVVTLQLQDVINYFDIPYLKYIQGACYYDGKLVLLNGLSGNSKLSIVDLNKKKLVTSYVISSLFANNEPEMLTQQEGIFYYSDVKGNFYRFYLENAEPAKTVIKNAKARKRKVSLNWKKRKGTGYEVQYKQAGAKAYKSILIKNYKKNNLTIKKLKKKKKYLIRVRAYKTVNGVTLYSKWSKVKKVTIK